MCVSMGRRSEVVVEKYDLEIPPPPPPPPPEERVRERSARERERAAPAADCGVGMLLEISEAGHFRPYQQVFVKDLVPGGAAAQSGAIPVGSCLVAVDGWDLDKLDGDQIAALIRGPEGSEIALLINTNPAAMVQAYSGDASMTSAGSAAAQSTAIADLRTVRLARTITPAGSAPVVTSPASARSSLTLTPGRRQSTSDRSLSRAFPIDSLISFVAPPPIWVPSRSSTSNDVRSDTRASMHTM